MIRISDGVPQHHDEEAIHKEVENVVTAPTILTRVGEILRFRLVRNIAGMLESTPMKCHAESTFATALNMSIGVNFPEVEAIGTDFTYPIGRILFSKAAGNYQARIIFMVPGSPVPTLTSVLTVHNDYVGVHNRPIRDIKNHAHSALSGVKKLIELDIGGVPYYFEVYPTKA